METILKDNTKKAIFLVFGLVLGVFLFLFPILDVLKVTIGIVLIALVFLKPEVGIYLVGFTLPFIQFKEITFLVLLIVIALFIKLITDKEKKMKKVPFGYALMFFIVPIVFSALTSYTPQDSIKQLIIYLIAIGILYLAVNLIDTKEKLYRFIIIIIFASLLVSLIGLYQYKIGVASSESWIDKELNPNLQTRVYSTLQNPNILAEYLVLLIPLTLSVMWVSKNRTKKLLFIMILVIQGLCLILTFSRGGWLAFAFAMVVFALFVDRRLMVLYAIVGIIGLLISPDVILTRLATIGNVQDTSTSYRFPIYMSAIDAIKDYWVTGVGLGPAAFKAVYPKYMRMGILAAHTHNIYLQIFVETGFFGFIGFLTIIFTVVKSNLITFAKSLDNRLKVISIGVLSSLSGLLLQGIVENIFFSEKIVVMFWIWITIGLITYKLAEKEKINLV